MKFLAKDPATRSNTSVCLTLNLSSDEMKKFVNFRIVCMSHMILEATEMHRLVLIFGAEAPLGLPMWRPYYHGLNGHMKK